MEAPVDIPEIILDPRTGDPLVVASELRDFRSRMVMGDPTIGWSGDSRLEIYRQHCRDGSIRYQIWRFFGNTPAQRARVSILVGVPTPEFLREMARCHFTRYDFAADAEAYRKAERADADRKMEELVAEMTDHARHI